MAFLMNELRLNDRRALLKDILENAVPVTLQDVVLIFCTVTGWKDGQLDRRSPTRARSTTASSSASSWSAIQITTAASLCAVLDLHAHGKLPDQGLRAAGAGGAGRVPGQPLRQVLRLRHARRAGDERRSVTE